MMFRYLDTKDPQADVGQMSIRPFRIRSLCKRRRSEGFLLPEYVVTLIIDMI